MTNERIVMRSLVMQLCIWQKAYTSNFSIVHEETDFIGKGIDTLAFWHFWLTYKKQIEYDNEWY